MRRHRVLVLVAAAVVAASCTGGPPRSAATHPGRSTNHLAAATGCPVTPPLPHASPFSPASACALHPGLVRQRRALDRSASGRGSSCRAPLWDTVAQRMGYEVSLVADNPRPTYDQRATARRSECGFPCRDPVRLWHDRLQPEWPHLAIAWMLAGHWNGRRPLAHVCDASGDRPLVAPGARRFPVAVVDATFIWTPSHDQRQCSLVAVGVPRAEDYEGSRDRAVQVCGQQPVRRPRVLPPRHSHGA